MSSCVEVGTASARRHHQAFTLMEMVVVASIIVVIIAIILPAIGKARESGRRARCVSNMTQIGHGLTAYCMDNNGAFPATASASVAANPADWVYWRATTTTPPEKDPFYFAKSPIMKTLGTQDEAILRCPSDEVDTRGITTAPYGTYKYSYVMNYMMTSFPIAGTPGTKTIARLPGVKNPSSKVWVYEEDESTLDDGTGVMDGSSPTTPGGVPQDLLSLRHDRSHGADNLASGRGNVLFCDGHTDLMSRAELHDVNGEYTNPTK